MHSRNKKRGDFFLFRHFLSFHLEDDFVENVHFWKFYHFYNYKNRTVTVLAKPHTSAFHIKASWRRKLRWKITPELFKNMVFKLIPFSSMQSIPLYELNSNQAIKDDNFITMQNRGIVLGHMHFTHIQYTLLFEEKTLRSLTENDLLMNVGGNLFF